MKSGLVIFSKIVVYLAAAAALAVCVVLLPELAREAAVEQPVTAYLGKYFLIGAYVLSIPFFVALWQTLRLLHYLDAGEAFSAKSVKALQNIQICAVVFSVLMVIATVAAMSVARSINPHEDVTHIVAIGFIFTFIASVIATVVAVLRRLLQSAVDIKSENDLIV